MSHKAFNKFMIEIINEEISNFNNTKFTDVPDELFQKLKLRKFSDDANKSHMKLFKAKDGNNFLVKKIINEDIFKVYNLEDFQNPNLGFYGVRLKERQDIESIYIFDESKLIPEGEIDLKSPEVINQIGQFYKDFTKDKNFLEEDNEPYCP